MLSQRLFKLVCIMVVGTGLIEEVAVMLTKALAKMNW